MIFTCPHTHKQYNAEPIETYELGDYRGVAVRCWWCDAGGRIRGESGFNPENRQIHHYDVTEKEQNK